MDTDAAWEAFAKTLRDQYPSITRKEKDRLVAQRKALMENPASFDLSKSQLKPSSAEWITYADREMARLADSDKPEDRKLLAERQKAKAAILKDPKSYTKLELTAEAEHKLQVLNRKIAMMEEVLTGPAV